MPLAVFVKEVHLLGVSVGVDHVQVKCLVLFTPEAPRYGPVVVLGDGDHVGQWQVNSVHSVHLQHVEGYNLRLWEKLHLQDEALVRKVAFHLEG